MRSTFCFAALLPNRHATLSGVRSGRKPLLRTHPLGHSDTAFFSQSAFWKVGTKAKAPLLRRNFSQRANAFDSGRSVRNALFGLIGINTAVFAAWQYADYYKDYKLRRQLMQNTTLTHENIKDGRYWTLLTSAFSHQNFMHFLFNMVSLHAFGSVISFVPGVQAVHFLSLTLGSGIAGSVAWLYHRSSKDSAHNASVRSTFENQRDKVMYFGLGASGLVMGAGAVATCLMPFAPMALFFIPIPVPLFVLTGAYFAIDAYYLDRGDRIGHAAHLGGSIYGVLFYFAYLRKFGGVWQLARRALRK